MSSKPLILLDPHPRTEAMVYTPEVRVELESMARVVAHFGSRAPDAMVEAVLGEVAVIIGQTAMPRARLDRAPNLRAILNVKANWEPNIDYPEAHRRGIYVLSAAPAMAPAVAEMCLGQAIALGRGAFEANQAFRAGTERYGIAGNARASSLFDAPVGMVGFGNLGRALLPLLGPFGCRVAVHDPWLSNRYLETQGVVPMPLEAVLASSRFVFLLAGVTADNEGFLDRAMLEHIADDAVVVLASRAEIVDFDAFVHLASAGHFRAAIDVFPAEPVPAESACRGAPGILFTSHLAGGIEDSYARMRDLMLDDVRQVLAGHPPLRMQRAEPHQAAAMRSR